jgi:hypothetical protein
MRARGASGERSVGPLSTVQWGTGGGGAGPALRLCQTQRNTRTRSGLSHLQEATPRIWHKPKVIAFARDMEPEMINYAMAVGDGKVKTFPLRGIKDNPPFLHDQRLLTLDDTVEFFNLTLAPS